MPGDVFTYEREDQRYSLRRGKRAVELSKTVEDSLAIVGEDTLIELGEPGEPLESIKANGQTLRFALITAKQGLTLARLQQQETVSLVTSFPIATWMLSTQLNLPAYVDTVEGCVEAELSADGPYAAAIELVQSGDTVRDNGLWVVEDDLYALRLMKIGKGILQ